MFGACNLFLNSGRSIVREEAPAVAAADSDTEELLAQASQGNGRARERLLDRHRDRLRLMVACRLDRRLAARVDPSDVVQEALAEAAAKLSDYVRERPVPFYPWLRRLAWERLVKLHRGHLQARKRSALREEHWRLPDESAAELAQRLFARGSSPSRHLLRQELRERVQEAPQCLSERDREVLVLRYLEQLASVDIAAVLGLTEGAVKVRHLRALERLRALLGDAFKD
jgi:RNA polymerase sigma-70 factor (ECF subfamily)